VASEACSASRAASTSTPAVLDVGPRGLHLEAQPLLPPLGVVVGGARLVHGRLDLEQRRGGGRPADRPVRPEQVALGGDRAQLGVPLHQRRGGRQ
jgi:hypothetical protein